MKLFEYLNITSG